MSVDGSSYGTEHLIVDGSTHVGCRHYHKFLIGHHGHGRSECPKCDVEQLNGTTLWSHLKPQT